MAPKDSSDSKIMDVAKPSQKKPDNTARPVIVGHTNTMAQDPMMSKPVATTAPEISKAAEPISKTGKTVEVPEAPKEEAKKPQIVIIKDASESEEEPVAVEKPEVPAVAEEPAKVEELAPEAEAEKAAEASPEEPATPAAEVTEEPALAGETTETDTVETTEETPADGEAKAKAEPINAENEKVNKLIVSKEYFLPIKKSRSKASGHHHTKLVWVLLLIAILVGAYVAIDAQLVKNDIKLPYHVFKNIKS